MDVQRQLRMLALRRCYQCCRHEEQLWVLAYEQVSPQTRRFLPEERINQQAARYRQASTIRRA